METTDKSSLFLFHTKDKAYSHCAEHDRGIRIRFKFPRGTISFLENKSYQTRPLYCRSKQNECKKTRNLRVSVDFTESIDVKKKITFLGNSSGVPYEIANLASSLYLTTLLADKCFERMQSVFEQSLLNFVNDGSVSSTNDQLWGEDLLPDPRHLPTARCKPLFLQEMLSKKVDDLKYIS